MKGKSVNTYKNLILAICMLFITMLLCSCSTNEAGDYRQDNMGAGESKKLRENVEEKYGIADNPIYARRISQTEMVSGSKTYTSELKENSKGGSIFYKTVAPKEQANGLICVYLNEENDNVALNAAYVYDFTDSLYSGSSILQMSATTNFPITKSCYYALIRDNYFAKVVMSEHKKVASDDLIYEEEIEVYKLLDSGWDEVYSIRRELESKNHGLKVFEIRSDSEWIIYAEGYDSFIAEGAAFVSTQEEFCDRANQYLKESSLECITINKTSWNNRWFGMDVDESRIDNDIVKVEFLYSDPVKKENGEEVTDITIQINAEKQQLAAGEQLEKTEDHPVEDGQNTESVQQEPLVMPEYIPKSIDGNNLQNLRYFNIDGFWHSSDNRYVYHILHRIQIKDLVHSILRI